MTPCEWNPTLGRPAHVGDEPHGEAVVRVGGKGEWFLCTQCAAMKLFKRYRVHRPMKPGAGQRRRT